MKNKKNIYKQLRESTETDNFPALTQQQLSNIFKDEGNPISQSAISKLETSKKEPPTTSFEVIKAYSEHFKVTSDYLLGLRNTKQIDENISMINKVTGFSDISINKLKKYSTLQRDIIDKLLSTEAIDKIIDAYVYLNLQFFHKIKIIDTIHGEYQASDKECSNFHFFQSFEMLKEALEIISNSGELQSELTDSHVKERTKEFWKVVVDTQSKHIGIEKTISNLSKANNVPKYAIDYAKELLKNQNNEYLL